MLQLLSCFPQPGMWNAQQVAGWKQVTDAVHAEGGKLVAQLWHIGRGM